MMEEGSVLSTGNDTTGEDGSGSTGGLLTQPPEEEEVTRPPESGSSSSSPGTDNDDEVCDEDSEEEGRETTTIHERREANMKRNQEVLERLGLCSGPLLGGRKSSVRKRRPPESDGDASDEEGEDDNDDNRPRGMLIPKVLEGSSHKSDTAMSEGAFIDPTANKSDSESFDDRLDALYDKYPHRESQIRQLLGLLAPMGAGVGCDFSPGMPGASPAPILISGPGGTGKTAIVRDVLEILSSNNVNHGPQQYACRSTMVATAYVNCTTLDVPSSMEELTNCIYGQFEARLLKQVSPGETKSSSRTQKRKRKRAKVVPEPVVDHSRNVEEQEQVPAVNEKRGRSHLARAATTCDGGNSNKKNREKHDVWASQQLSA